MAIVGAPVAMGLVSNLADSSSAGATCFSFPTLLALHFLTMIPSRREQWLSAVHRWTFAPL